MFVQKLNPLTGEADWVLVNDPGLGDEDDASADLVATSSYLDMLTDRRRNAAYYAAMRRVIPARRRAAAAAAAAAAGAASSSSSGGAGAGTDGPSAIPAPSDPEDVRVLDIGTGTGLLAMMAARVLATDNSAGTAGGGDAATGAAAAAAAAGDAPASAPVIACEVFPPMQNLSRRVIAGNGLTSTIRVLNKRSDEIVVQQPGKSASATPA
ncbi:hypothetical protein VaNZ11_007699, partial [Volvox africanus]